MLIPQGAIRCKRANLAAGCLWLASDHAMSVTILDIVKPLAKRQDHALWPSWVMSQNSFLHKPSTFWYLSLAAVFTGILRCAAWHTDRRSLTHEERSQREQEPKEPAEHSRQQWHIHRLQQAGQLSVEIATLNTFQKKGGKNRNFQLEVKKNWQAHLGKRKNLKTKMA